MCVLQVVPRNVNYLIILGRNLEFFSRSDGRPVAIVLVKGWKVAKKLPKSKTLLPKFQKLPLKFLDIFIYMGKS